MDRAMIAGNETRHVRERSGPAGAVHRAVAVALVLLAGLVVVGPAVSGPAAAQDVIALPGDRLFPEGIAAAEDGTLYVGSVTEGTILRIPPGAAAAEPFVPAGAGGLLSVMGLAADDRTGRLWACSSNLGVGARPSNESPAVKAFDLATGAPLGSFPLPGEGLCNDLAVGPDGAVYVTDSRNPRLLRLPPGGGRLEEWLRDERFAGDGTNLNGIAFTGPRTLLVDKSNSGDLFRIDLDAADRPEAVTAVTLSRPLRGPDGLRAHDAATLLAGRRRARWCASRWRTIAAR